MDNKNTTKNNSLKIFCSLVTSFIFLLWDGLVFFGHDDNKLNRLKGVKPRWYDRFLNKRWLMFELGLAGAMYVVLNYELGLIGTIKSQ